MLTTASPDNGL